MKGTSTQEELLKWNLKHKMLSDIHTYDEIAIIGVTYLLNLQRNGSQL